MNGLVTLSRSAAFALLLAVGGSMLSAGAANAGDLTVDNVWARPSGVAGGNGAGYFTVENKGAADTLLKVEADVSKTAELHSMSMEGMVMKMRKLDSAPVPADGKLVFAPGGNHIMFIGLKAPLKEGDTFPVTFVFEHAGSIKATMKVAQPTSMPMGNGATGGAMGGMGSMGGMH